MSSKNPEEPKKVRLFLGSSDSETDDETSRPSNPSASKATFKDIDKEAAAAADLNIESSEAANLYHEAWKNIDAKIEKKPDWPEKYKKARKAPPPLAQNLLQSPDLILPQTPTTRTPAASIPQEQPAPTTSPQSPDEDELFGSELGMDAYPKFGKTGRGFGGFGRK
jgi:hypothetical protein